MKRLVSVASNIVALSLGVASIQCTAEGYEDSVGSKSQKMVSIDSVLCEARESTIVANTGSILVNGGTTVDSYESSQGAYGGSNVGEEAVLQAANTINDNGGTIAGSELPYSPAGFAPIPVPEGVENLPLGASNPGSLNINSASESVTLPAGDYVVQWVNINGSGSLNVEPGAEVRIWVTGGLNLGGDVNDEGTPDQLTFVLPNPGWVNLNSGELHGLLYAPTSGINVGGDVFGSIIGSNVTINSGGNVHYDLDSQCDDEPLEAELDQSFTTPGGLSAGLYGPGAWMAQTYTAGITGTLYGASIEVDALNPNYPARIQVRTVVNGEPSDVILGEGMAASGGDLSLDDIIVFPTPIPQVAGEQYALLVDYPDAPPFVDGAWNIADWIGSQEDGYPGGFLTGSLDDADTWNSWDEQWDLLFTTYVLPN